MSYDKVIDSSVLDANLKSVADAIRTKGGTSANLAFPTGFVNAISAIETGGNMEKHEITFASDVVVSNAETTLLTNNAFIKEHYAKDGFYIVMRPKTKITTVLQYGLVILYHGNRQLLSGASISYGVHSLINGSSGVANANISGKVNGTTWNLGFRATSAGKLTIYQPASRPIVAGTYEIFLVCEE